MPKPDRLLIATTSTGKKREYEALLADWPLLLTWPDAEGLSLQIRETGATYAENACLKARAYAEASGLWSLADDSGLEVDALGGAPGMYAARFAGAAANDRDRWQLLLQRLADVPWPKRTARFRCLIALASPTGQTWLSEGVCEGMIAFSPQGEEGFGYDPVFYLPELGCTMAELPMEVKNRLSHRAKAVAAMKELLYREILSDD